MTEALIVSAVVVSALVLIYMQFARLNKAYNDSYYYNNINSMYTLNQIGTYISEDHNNTMASNVNSYLDLTNCSYLNNNNYCNLILTKADIKYLLLAPNNRNTVLTALNSNNPYDLRLQNFMKTIDDSDTSYSYMLIGAFNNGTYASIPFNL